MISILRISKQESKDKIKRVVLVFEIKINSNNFIISLLPKKIDKGIVVTRVVLL